MASFTESATLILRDKSTANIRKVNNELKKLFATAKQMKRMQLGLDIKNLSKAQSKVQAITKDVASLSRRRANIQVQINARAAQAQLNNLTRRRRVDIFAGMKMSGFDIGRSIARGFYTSIGGRTAGALGRLIGKNVVEGGRAQDISQFRLETLPLTGAERTGVNAAIDTLVKEQRTLNRFQVEQLAAEVIPSFVGPGGAPNIQAAQQAIPELVSLIEDQIARGMDPTQAREAALNYVKAGLAAGRLVDEQGNINKQWFNLLRKTGNVIGEEFTGPGVRDLFRNAPNLRQTLSDRGVQTLFALGEEDRTKVSTAWETLRQSIINGSVKQDRLFALNEAGLINIESWVNKRGKIVREFVSPTKEGEVLLRDPLALAAFIEKQRPKIESALGRTFEDTAEGNALLASALVSNRNAQQAIATLLSQDQQIINQLEFADRQTGTIDEARIARERSLLLSSQRLNSSFEGLAGQMVRTVEPMMTPVMGAVTDVFTHAADAMAKGEAPNWNVLISDMMKAAPGMAGMIAATKGLATTGALGAIGTTAGLAAMMDPATRPLGAAGLALSGAAGELSAAAQMQMMATGAGMLGGDAKGLGKAAFLGKLRQAGWWGVAAAAAIEGGIMADAALGIETGKPHAGGFGETRPGESPETVETFRKVLSQFSARLLSPPDVGGMARAYAEAEAGLGKLTITTDKASDSVTQLSTASDYAKRSAIDRADQESMIYSDMVSLYKNEVARMGALAPKQQWLEQLKMSRQTDQLEGLIASGKLDPDQISQARKYIEELNTLLQVSTPSTTKGIVLPETGAAPVPWGRDQEPPPQSLALLAEGTNQIAEAFNLGSTQVATSVTTASTSIQAGLTTGGQSAGATIASAMIAASATVGNTIAAAVRNAAASVQVNVNTTPAADVGAQSVTG